MIIISVNNGSYRCEPDKRCGEKNKAFFPQQEEEMFKVKLLTGDHDFAFAVRQTMYLGEDVYRWLVSYRSVASPGFPYNDESSVSTTHPLFFLVYDIKPGIPGYKLETDKNIDQRIIGAIVKMATERCFAWGGLQPELYAAIVRPPCEQSGKICTNITSMSSWLASAPCMHKGDFPRH